MKVKNIKPVWNVMCWDFNREKIEIYNILSNQFLQELHKEIVKKKTITNYNELKERMRRRFLHDYWSKSECEILVGGLFSKSFSQFQKIDMYYQIMLNLDRIVEYVINICKIEF
jgi:hypothetical protein